MDIFFDMANQGLSACLPPTVSAHIGCYITKAGTGSV